MAPSALALDIRTARLASRPAMGVCAPWDRSEPPQGAKDGVRVDAEVKSGQALVD